MKKGFLGIFQYKLILFFFAALLLFSNRVIMLFVVGTEESIGWANIMEGASDLHFIVII